MTASGTTSTAMTTTSSTGTGAGGDAGALPAEPCPDWPGWEEWNDFAPTCPLCVPASKEALPAPIAWEPCAAASSMPVGCRQMKVDWPFQSTPFAYTPSVDVSPDGHAVMSIIRLSDAGPKPSRMGIIADADGPVHSAFLDPRGQEIKGCTYFPNTVVSLSSKQHVMGVVDGDLVGQYPQAAVGGSIDELHPRVQWSWDKSGGRMFAASDAVWATTNGVEVGIARWGEPLQTVFTSTQAGGLEQVAVRAFHDLVTWDSGNDLHLGVMAWTQEKGAFPLITFPGDWSRGANGLGTDGHSFVWMYGEGKTQPIAPYPKVSVMTAPFTTDPAALKPKRLRSLATEYPLVAPWIVGCGYAANEYEANQILVVRLSDGWAWKLTDPNPTAPPLERWHYGTVYGISCDEIYLRAGVGPQMNVARVRLDALGPGMPPD